MTADLDKRTGTDIITDLYNLTNDMVRQRDDADFLIEGVDRREKLMDEYDAYAREHPDEDQTEIKKMIREIIVLDKKIRASVTAHKVDVESKLAEAKNKQQLMGSYLNNMQSAAGSYMDYKK